MKTSEFGFGKGREDGIVFGDKVGRDELKAGDALDGF